MATLCTRDELQRRFYAFERQHTIASAIGFTPFVVIYLCVHPCLEPWLPRSREADLVLLIVLPAIWFAAVMLVHGWLAPGPLGLRCVQCAQGLLGKSYANARTTGHCDDCCAAVISDPQSA